MIPLPHAVICCYKIQQFPDRQLSADTTIEAKSTKVYKTLSLLGASLSPAQKLLLPWTSPKILYWRILAKVTMKQAIELEKCLSNGESVDLPEDTLEFLFRRRAEQIQHGPWVEKHYRPGRRFRLGR